MARWYALDREGQRIGEVLEAPDRPAAEAAAARAHGAKVATVQSLLSWQASQAILKRAVPADE